MRFQKIVFCTLYYKHSHTMTHTQISIKDCRLRKGESYFSQNIRCLRKVGVARWHRVIQQVQQQYLHMCTLERGWLQKQLGRKKKWKKYTLSRISEICAKAINFNVLVSKKKSKQLTWLLQRCVRLSRIRKRSREMKKALCK